MRNLGGMMAGVSAVALGLCSMSDGTGDEGGGGGGGGGAANLLDDPNPNPNPDPNPNPAPAKPLEVADWMKTFSGDPVGEDLSNQEWLAKKGFATPDALAASYRAAEKTIREGGKVKIPGENATDEERAAFREAIGAPKEAAGYEITMPEGAENFHIDTAIIEPLKEIALKHGVPAAAFKDLAGQFLAAAVDDAKAEVARTDADAAAQIKEWGPQAAQRTEEFRRGAQLLGLSRGDIADIQREFGAGKTLEMFAKIGSLAGEDFFAQGNPSQRFGIPNLEAAQAQLDAMINDPGVAALLNKKDPATVAKYNRLVEGVSAFRQSASKR